MAAPHLAKAMEQLEIAEAKAVEFQDALDGYTFELETAVNTKDLSYDHIKDIVFSLASCQLPNASPLLTYAQKEIDKTGDAILSFVRALTSTLPQKLEMLSHATTSQEEFLAEAKSVRDTHLALIRELGRSLVGIADECEAKEVELARNPAGGSAGGDDSRGKPKTHYEMAVESFEHPERFTGVVKEALESSARLLGYTPGSGERLDSRVTYGIIPKDKRVDRGEDGK